MLIIRWFEVIAHLDGGLRLRPSEKSVLRVP